MSVVPPTGLSYESPGEPWLERINWRIIIFVGVIVALIGLPFGMWLNETVSGGIHDYGGYKEVDLKAMSSFDMDQVNATPQDIPAKFRALEGKRVMMKGEMWSPRSAASGGLGYFQLVYSRTKCCFSGPPLAQHFVDADVMPKVQVEYSDGPVKVWGTMHIIIRKDEGGVIKSIYHVNVDKVEDITG